MRRAPETSAATAAATILRTCFGELPAGPRNGLTLTQHDAVARLDTILQRHGGALLCDSVGLGKTHIAAALIRSAIAHGPVLVTAPAQLREHWHSHLRDLRGWSFASHTRLSRNTHAPARRMTPAPPAFVVVDEAHAFRNARTRRYASLARLVANARVLLITATPVNNSPWDLYHLIRLFAADDAFTHLGVGDLRDAITSAAAGQASDIRRITHEVMVRRTRDIVRRTRDTRRTISPAATRFPACAGTELVRCTALPPDEVRRACTAIASLGFAAHRAASGDIAAELIRIGLLKRLESGLAAFAASIRRLRALTSAFITAARSGLLFHARRDAHLVRIIDGAQQLALQPLTLVPWPAALDRDDLVTAALRDADTLRDITPHDTRSDAKLLQLRALLQDIADRVIVFTEFRDTAIALHRALVPLGRVALVHGADARVGQRTTSRTAVAARFAPPAARPRPRHRIDDVRILIATDVLAEGMNLQAARVVVSYDLPWNPVRLAQRAGRIDRMGSPHTDIRVIAFSPAHELEQLTGILRRVRTKIRHIRTIAGDAPATFSRRRLLDTDTLAHERELARLELLRTHTHAPATHTDAPGLHAPLRAAFDCAQDGVVCCISTGDNAHVLLIPPDGEPLDASVDAWRALRAALHRQAPVSPTAMELATMRRAERAAMRHVASLARAPSAPSPRTRRDAASRVRAWLAALPDPGPADYAAADRALHNLTGPRRDISLQHALRLDLSPEELVHTLATGPTPVAAPASGRPRVVASILLRTAAPQR